LYATHLATSLKCQLTHGSSVGIGPFLGAAVAAGIYKALLVVDYRSANPGQDADEDAVVGRSEVFVDAAGVGEGPSSERRA
jgi:hypothetical protein